MSYHAELSDYTQQLSSAIEEMDIEKIMSVCQQAVSLIRSNEPVTLADQQPIMEFADKHAVAESLVKEVRDRLSLEVGRSKNARKGIQKYRGVSGNV
ncbi:hypothetical protein CBF23_012325 [Marinomonas agarivorans]|nr:hypothetical protein CBF23_012325 [Marinomonas agarivorans]